MGGGDGAPVTQPRWALKRLDEDLVRAVALNNLVGKYDQSARWRKRGSSGFGARCAGYVMQQCPGSEKGPRDGKYTDG